MLTNSYILSRLSGARRPVEIAGSVLVDCTQIPASWEDRSAGPHDLPRKRVAHDRVHIHDCARDDVVLRERCQHVRASLLWRPTVRRSFIVVDSLGRIDPVDKLVAEVFVREAEGMACLVAHDAAHDLVGSLGIESLQVHGGQVRSDPLDVGAEVGPIPPPREADPHLRRVRVLYEQDVTVLPPCIHVGENAGAQGRVRRRLVDEANR